MNDAFHFSTTVLTTAIAVHQPILPLVVSDKPMTSKLHIKYECCSV